MSETEASVTTNQGEADLSKTEPRPFTGVWNDLTHGDYKAMLGDIKTEAEAAIASGEPTVQKWARTAGTFASLLGIFLEHTAPAEFNKLAGVAHTVEQVGEEAVNLATKTTP